MLSSRTISAAIKKDAKVKKDGVFFKANGHNRVLNPSVSPLGTKDSVENRFFLILFEDVTQRWIQDPRGVSRRGRMGEKRNRQESKRLSAELTDAQDALRSAIESEDALKEEFQSANEEILSANEELQSTNEELETSKEELQSANEELNTLNDELRGYNVELSQLNNDLRVTAKDETPRLRPALPSTSICENVPLYRPSAAAVPETPGSLLKSAPKSEYVP